MGKSLVDICSNQLRFDPTSSQKKRVKPRLYGFCLSYRTWRIEFKIQDQVIHVINLKSGYSDDELLSQEDPYSDKDLHREFVSRYN